ncbi:MAG: helix-turn-helix transcriptional regulator [Gammaproteobacteria bacterium]
MTTKRARSSEAREFLERIRGEPLSLGALLGAIREGEGWSQTRIGKLLGVSRAHICDIEKGRRLVTPDRAVRWAKALGYGEKQFVRLALQDQLRAAGVNMKVDVHAA